MGYEIYAETLVSHDDEYERLNKSTQHVAYITYDGAERAGALEVRLGGPGAHLKITQASEDDGATVVVLEDFFNAWLRLRRLAGYDPEGVGDSLAPHQREEAARVFETAAKALEDSGEAGLDELARDLRAAGLQVISLAARAEVPLSTVDPEDFDAPIRVLRRRLASEGLSSEDRAEMAGEHDGLQKARAAVLGSELPTEED